MQTAKILGSETFRYTEPITLVGLFFLVFSLIAAGLVRLVETWLAAPPEVSATTATPMVRFDQVTKSYGSFTVLDRLDLEIAEGEKVSIIGPSGSGKTTVLRMLMTLERINEGVIWVDGEPLTHMERNGGLVPADDGHLRRIRGKIGMVFQQFNLFPHMTALGNCMEAPVTVLKMPKAEAEARARELLAMVGLADKTGHYPSQLSGGQQQRVAIARACAMRPKVMLFDEVTSASTRSSWARS